MTILYNLIGVLLVFLWNAAVMAGAIWLILEKDWSPWTLVTTLFFFSRWKEWTPETGKKEPEVPKIIL